MGWVSNVCHLLFNCSSSSTPPLSSLSDFVPSVLPSMDVAFIPNFGSQSTEITEVVDCYGLTPPLILDMGLEVGGSWSDWKHRKLGNENGRGTRVDEWQLYTWSQEQLYLQQNRLWGTLLADIVIQMLGTDYARIVRAIYAFPQVYKDVMQSMKQAWLQQM
ncbi:unnamed protein product [Lactuca saligna]|uniref:Uncharacterized protein n=1 Tax=Lactuca saligna TaxID=75948 RepID=A0AA36E4I5_LACSI|nr:unnamed protein product [Lactuca saligna]